MRESTPQTVSSRQLNRWTLARQMLLGRVDLDAVTAIERLAGMQAQYSPSPYIGLWTRLRGFQRSELEGAVMEDRVIKATLMRGTLHLVSARDFDRYRAASRSPHHNYSKTVQIVRDRGGEIEAIRERIIAACRERPLKRLEMEALIRPHLPADLPDFVGWSTMALSGELINVAEDARFGYFGGSRYRVAPPPEADPGEARRHFVAAYLSAFGPASRGDLSQWSGQNVSGFTQALDELNPVTFRGEDGRALLDLREAPRPEADIAAPVRFLPKWDNLLLAHDRRDRVLPERYRKTVIRKNGDVLPTFLVDGVVAGVWDAPLKGRAILSLTALEPIETRIRRELEAEGQRLLGWLRPDTDRRDILWMAE